MPELKEKRSSPCFLPVNEASNSIAFHKEIRGMNVPMPKSRTGELPFFLGKMYGMVSKNIL